MILFVIAFLLLRLCVKYNSLQVHVFIGTPCVDESSMLTYYMFMQFRAQLRCNTKCNCFVKLLDSNQKPMDIHDSRNPVLSAFPNPKCFCQYFCWQHNWILSTSNDEGYCRTDQAADILAFKDPKTRHTFTSELRVGGAVEPQSQPRCSQLTYLQKKISSVTLCSSLQNRFLCA